MQAEIPRQEALYGIVFDETRSKVVLVKRRDIPVWVLPGGGRDRGEEPAEGVIREVREETGFQVEIVRKVAEYLPVNWMTQFTHTFECRVVGGEATTGEETQEVRFFPLDHLPLMSPPFASWIADAETRHPHLLRKNVEGVTHWVLFKLMVQHPLLVARYLLTKLGIHINRG